MSRTDKTRPYWVQFMDPDNCGWKVEYHDHRDHICDIEKFNAERDWVSRWRWGRCGYHESMTAMNCGIYMRSSAVRVYREKDLGKVRGRERRMIRELLKISREDMIDYDYMPSQHRRNALWEAY